jgi:uncharacterized protein (TIGR03067 family)
MLAAVCVLLALPAAEPKKDELAKKELEKLQGTWKLVSIEKRGQKFDAEGKVPDSFNMVIAGDKMTFGKREITFTIDLTTDPKLIDLTHVKEKVTIESIYKLDGDTFTMCYRPGDAPAKDRPTAFKTDEKTTYEIRVYKREKK